MAKTMKIKFAVALSATDYEVWGSKGVSDGEMLENAKDNAGYEHTASYIVELELPAPVENTGKLKAKLVA